MAANEFETNCVAVTVIVEALGRDLLDCSNIAEKAVREALHFRGPATSRLTTDIYAGGTREAVVVAVTEANAALRAGLLGLTVSQPQH